MRAIKGNANIYLINLRLIYRVLTLQNNISSWYFYYLQTLFRELLPRVRCFRDIASNIEGEICNNMAFKLISIRMRFSFLLLKSCQNG